LDTVVKARYDRGLTAGIRLAKEHLRYAVHRTNEHGQRQYREVWDRAGALDKATAYERLDAAGPRDYVYRLTLSPHPERQDAGQRLDLREWGRAMMARLGTVSGQQLEWFAVTHAHVEHRHVHVVVRTRGHFTSAHFRAMREVGDQQA
jgi:type IV secretory pathway VirD2 relaxase